MKLLNNLKFLFVCRGPGETGQARALAKFLEKKGAKIIFCLHQEKNLFFLKSDKNFEIFLTKTPQELKKIVKIKKPKFLFLFNSKMWDENFKKECPFKKPDFVFCFDSNWLFNEKKYPFYSYVKWADKYFILFPKRIFELGLKKNGGKFEIEKEIEEKMLPIGFIPSYKKISEKKQEKIREKLGIKKQEKFIFSYFSGWGAGHRIWAFENMILALEKLIKKRKKIKALYVGPTENLNLEKIKREWLMVREKLSAQEFFEILCAADLVFMHQGMVTLAQAIFAQIPVLCNVSFLPKERIRWLHYGEVEPFKRAGVCEMCFKSTKIEKISQKIEKLLFSKKERDKMKRAQKEIAESGEANFLKELQKIL